MKKEIEKKLKEIETKENVRIILAVESGSRAWGFASEDSDYDVRFVYVRNQKEYLKLNEEKDVIEWELNEVMDVNGWDVKKALRLMHKSNPTIFEWLYSSVVYRTSEEADSLRKLSEEYFSEKKMIAHYYHMAKNNYDAYIRKDNVRLKKYFYVLRPVLAAKYIMHHHKMAPLSFQTLVEKELDPAMHTIVERLLEYKKISNESLITKGEPDLNVYLEEEMKNLEKYYNGLKETNADWDPLNTYLYKLLKV